MSRILAAITAEPWAIRPDYLHLIVALAQRNGAAPEVVAQEGWEKRDISTLLAANGPIAKPLDGSKRAILTDGGVAILPVFGPIFPRANMMTEYSGATSAAGLQADYQVALNNPDVGAIMLLIDSPGGMTSGIAATADQIAAGRQKKPTTAFVSGTGASAAYWLASAAGQVILDRTAMVGSIGVVVGVPKQVEPDADGIMTVEIVSSNAPDKRPDPTTEGGVAVLQSLIDAVETQFISDVAKGRGVATTRVQQDFGRGGMLVGSDAVKAGMADRVQNYAAALRDMTRTVANQRKVDALRK